MTTIKTLFTCLLMSYIISILSNRHPNFVSVIYDYTAVNDLQKSKTHGCLLPYGCEHLMEIEDAQLFMTE